MLPSSSPSSWMLAHPALCSSVWTWHALGKRRSCGSAEGAKPLPLRFVISPLRKKHHHIMLKRVKGKVGGPGWDDSPHINLGLISAGSYSHKLTPLLWDLSFLMPFRTVAGTKMLSLSKWADCFTNFHGCFSCTLCRSSKLLKRAWEKYCFLQGIEITLLFIYNNNFIVNVITYHVRVRAHACINAHVCCGEGAAGPDTNCLLFYQACFAFWVSLLENYLLSIKWEDVKLNRDLT